MTSDHIARPAAAGNLLAFNGVEIRDRGDMLSLTDMWRASGSISHQKPADWLRDLGTKTFVEFVADRQKVLPEHLFQTSKGRTGATFAHWQIGLAYAKYLSPEFHMWCNTVVRERMEGRPAPTLAIPDLTAEVRKVIGGIVKNVVHAQLTEVMPALVTAYVADHSLSIAEGLTSGEVCDLSKVATKYPRGVSARVSRRLTQVCHARGARIPITRLGRVRAQVFPTHIVREWLDAEGRSLIRRWVDERKGQGALRLVPPTESPPR